MPIDRRVRYSADRSVGAVLSSQGGVLAGSFDISLEDFGNLAILGAAMRARPPPPLPTSQLDLDFTAG